MGVFKNEVGRPSNETIKKRNIFKGVCILLLILAVVLVAYILNDKGIIIINNEKTNSTNIETDNKQNNNEIKNDETDLAKKLHSYIPQFDSNRIGYLNAYQDKLIKIDDLDNEFLLLFIYRNIDVLNYTECNDIEIPGCRSYKENLFSEKAKLFFNKKLINQDFEVGYGGECIYKNNEYLCGEAGGSAESSNNVFKDEYKILKNNDKEFIFTDYYLLHDCEILQSDKENSEQCKLYDSSSRKNLISTTVVEPDYKLVVNPYSKYMKEYKHTFKRRSDGSYYWYSTEPINN